jgi:hypothetical protein
MPKWLLAQCARHCERNIEILYRLSFGCHWWGGYSLGWQRSHGQYQCSPGTVDTTLFQHFTWHKCEFQHIINSRSCSATEKTMMPHLPQIRQADGNFHEWVVQDGIRMQTMKWQSCGQQASAQWFRAFRTTIFDCCFLKSLPVLMLLHSVTTLYF